MSPRTAAIATCGAIQGDRRKLSYVTSLVLVVAMPMMVVMPWIAEMARMPDVVAGARLGGTLDTSAAVVVKLSQNALIGVVAFLLIVWDDNRSSLLRGDCAMVSEIPFKARSGWTPFALCLLAIAGGPGTMFFAFAVAPPGPPLGRVPVNRL